MATLSPAELMRLWFQEVWNERRADRIDALAAPGCVIHNIDETGGDAHGPAALRAFQARILAAFPDIWITMHEVIESGEIAAGRWSAKLTHSGDGLGVDPTGKAVTLTGMSMARVRDGRIVESWDEWDRMRLSLACGMVVPANQPGRPSS
ncbi:ester cyclase [Falsiroseomonas sp. HW251]|uniref:ester cyclase n=1 Tax=Falsiroseomonas sp. HW251 TaxID=3390998 RepID=UPI003D315B8E